jgi:hypothetical protein
MASRPWIERLVAAGTSFNESVRRRRSAKTPPPPPPPVDTMSSPGQIADAQHTYGAEMAPPSAAGPEDG